MTSVIRNSGGSSLPHFPALPYTRADEAGKGDAMLSAPGGRESTSKAPTYPDLAGKVAAVVDAIRSAGGEALGVAADCTELAAVERMRRRVEEEFGSVVVVAAFAGGGRARPGPVAQTTEEEWQSTVDANLTATFLTLKSFLPGMIGRRGGSIVTMASSAARFPTGAPSPYAVAKAGVIALTREVASEVGEHGVRANCLAPHTVLVERTRRFMPEQQQRRIVAEIPLRRLGTPEDVALATLFLASESSSWITGVTLDVAGGKATSSSAAG